MSKDYQAVTSDIVDYIRQMKPLIPGTMKGFYEMAAAASADGALEKKTRNLSHWQSVWQFVVMDA